MGTYLLASIVNTTYTKKSKCRWENRAPDWAAAASEFAIFRFLHVKKSSPH